MTIPDEQTPIKVVIPVEEETPFVPERPPARAKERLKNAGLRTTRVLKQVPGKLWRSKARKKVSGGLKRGAFALAAKGNRVMRDTVIRKTREKTREKAAAARASIQSRDWKREAQQSTTTSFRWMSQQLAKLAERLGAK